MTTHAVGPRVAHSHVRVAISRHWIWLGGGFAWAFAVPYLLADVLELQRDVFYGLYALAVVALFAAWARATAFDIGASLRRHRAWALGLGAAFAAVMAFVVIRTEDATARPDGVELAAAIIWRGLVYGATDGLLLSAFPILVVFAAFAGTRLRERLPGTVLVGVLAVLASLAMTAVYHAGYSDFRSDKVTKPMRGDLIWSVPTLVTLNPIGAPIAHAGLHVSAVVRSYETDVYLPPHE